MKIDMDKDNKSAMPVNAESLLIQRIQVKLDLYQFLILCSMEVYFSAFTGIVDLSYLSISIFIINLYQFLILCSSKVLLL